MKEFQQIIYEKSGHVATITLNRPEKLNAYSEIMVHEILAALGDARDDDEIRAVIITGAGRGFCSGGISAAIFNIRPAIADTAWNPCWRCARTCTSW